MRSYNKMPRFWINLCTFLLVAILLTACLGGGEEAGENPEAAPLPTALTVCTEQCRLQGQCGDNTDGQPVVLGMDIQPATKGHNQLFPQNTTINRLNSQDKIVRHPTTQLEETWQFVQIQTVEGGQIGWVAGMCLVDQ